MEDKIIEDVLAQLAFDDKGLIPAIAQDSDSGDVLMLAWMNADAVHATLSTSRVTYWSRSRQGLWKKGETSGHVQQLVSFRFDCDRDAIVMKVKQSGPACHTNRPNCFFYEVGEGGTEIISDPVE